MKEIIVRAYSPLGYYPSKSILSFDAALIQHEDLFFSFVKLFRDEPDDYYSEREWLYPVEIKFLSSLVLSVPKKHGKIYSYPDAIGYKVKIEDSKDLTHEDTIQKIKTELITKIKARNSHFWDVAPLGPLFGGPNYQVNTNADNVDYQNEIFTAIDLSNHLLIRGLGGLIKGDLLNIHHIFHTEACISLHIAMEASMYLIYRRLEENGEKPSPEKASKYISEIFGNSNPPKNYFEDFYEDRIKAVHPENRYGTYPDAPLAADDFYDLYKHLKCVYEFLVTGNIDKSY
ncbi:MAG: hypothetical protein WD022_11830 [Balneolaceae bacterium]